MSEEKHIIEPQRLGLWVAVTFILALLALVLSLVEMTRTSDALVVTQAEILLLNKKIQALEKNAMASAMPPAAPMEQAPMEQPPTP